MRRSRSGSPALEHLVALCLGIGLSAAVGLRLFVPPFLLGLAAAGGWLELPAGTAWLASPLAITAFGIAMLLEVLAYMIPWLDNALDSLASPLAVLAGILLTASFLGEMPPGLQWTLAIVAGGGASAATQGATAVARAASTATTGGVANPVLAAVETTASVVTTLLATVVPVLVAALVVGLALFSVSRLGRLRRAQRPS